MIDIRDSDFKLIDFVPESIASDPEIIALSLALDPELKSVGAAIIEAVILPRIDQLDDPVLDEIAWACRFNRLQIWDTATTAGKRALLRNMFQVRKKSGTKFAVRRVFDLMSVDGTVIEWFEEAAPAFTYRILITVGDVGITKSQLEQIAELTHRFESTRSKLREFAVRAAPAGGELRAFSTIGRYVSIGGP